MISDERLAEIGYRREWVEAGSDWRLATDTERAEKRCRFRSGYPTTTCGAAPVAALTRGYERPQWWLYCAEHMYGCRVRDGKVESQRLVSVDEG